VTASTATDTELIRAFGAVMVALITAVGGVVIALWRANQREHAENGGKLDGLVASVDDLKVGQAEIKADIADVKADVRELKTTDRDHEHRLEALEPTPIKSRTTRKKAAS
jgi:hypothetical protein